MRKLMNKNIYYSIIKTNYKKALIGKVKSILKAVSNFDERPPSFKHNWQNIANPTINRVCN